MMSLNFYCGCHVCKTKLFLFRNEESEGLHKFYRKHSECRRSQPCCVEVVADGYSGKDWMDSYKDDELNKIINPNKKYEEEKN